METTATERSNGASIIVCKVLSYLAHPFLVPLYILLLLFATGLIPLYVVPAVKRYLIGVVIVNTMLIPMMTIIILRLARVIPDYSLSMRRDRVLPLLILGLCYGLCGWMLQDIPTIFMLRRCIFAALGCVTFAFIVNLFWHVSQHMIAIGGALGVVSILLYAGYVNLIWILCGAILIAGAVATARLYLGRHNLSQVVVGFFGGFVIAVLILLMTT